MAVVYGTLAKETDGEVEYVYPKTYAAMVEFNTAQSVKDKLNEIDEAISQANARINNISSAIEYGSLGTKNDAELIDIRTPSYTMMPSDTRYETAGDAVRGQFNYLYNLFKELNYVVQELKEAVYANDNSSE